MHKREHGCFFRLKFAYLLPTPRISALALNPQNSHKINPNGYL
jgi:hypothetical protein